MDLLQEFELFIWKCKHKHQWLQDFCTFHRTMEYIFFKISITIICKCSDLKEICSAGGFLHQKNTWKVLDYLNVSQLRNKKQKLHPDFLLFSLFSLGIILQDALRGKTLIFQSHLTLLLWIRSFHSFTIWPVIEGFIQWSHIFSSLPQCFANEWYYLWSQCIVLVNGENENFL